MKVSQEIEFLRFITRIGMYVTVQDKHSIVSFINGFECGSGSREFSEGFRDFISKKYRVKSVATGWPGQIDRLVDKTGLDWVTIFKKSALDFIVSSSINNLTNELDHLLKTRVQTLAGRILESGQDDFSIQEWPAIYCSEFDWFRKLWRDEEWEVLQSAQQKIQLLKMGTNG